jgi:hypothetical protein
VCPIFSLVLAIERCEQAVSEVVEYSGIDKYYNIELAPLSAPIFAIIVGFRNLVTSRRRLYAGASRLGINMRVPHLVLFSRLTVLRCWNVIGWDSRDSQ